jgi:hypothetical protein
MILKDNIMVNKKTCESCIFVRKYFGYWCILDIVAKNEVMEVASDHVCGKCMTIQEMDNNAKKIKTHNGVDWSVIAGTVENIDFSQKDIEKLVKELQNHLKSMKVPGLIPA